MAPALPLLPELPLMPLAAVPLAVGLETAAPLVPPVELLLALDEPLAPLTAVPVAVELELPELPPAAIAVTSPELPVSHTAALDPRLIDSAMQSPVSPDMATTVAVPPAPVDEVEVGLEVAAPVAPVAPEVASDDELASPDAARPSAEGLEVAVPVVPVLPVSPEAAMP